MMNSLRVFLLILLALLNLQCHTTNESAHLFPSVDLQSLDILPAHSSPFDSSLPSPDTIITWNPRYISTGISSGIMIEFTGFKSEKPVNAKYSYLEYGQLDNDTTFTQMRSQINDLRQAFFTLPPGRYIIHHVTPWAEQHFISNVIVRDGQYSIIHINVLIPLSIK